MKKRTVSENYWADALLDRESTNNFIQTEIQNSFFEYNELINSLLKELRQKEKRIKQLDDDNSTENYSLISSLSKEKNSLRASLKSMKSSKDQMLMTLMKNFGMLEQLNEKDEDEAKDYSLNVYIDKNFKTEISDSEITGD